MFVLYSAIVILGAAISASASDADHVIKKRFDWHDEGSLQWSSNCDFFGNDLSDVQVPGERCGPACESNPSCTHFTWTGHNGGTCWLKQGGTSLDAAVRLEESSVCGKMKRGGDGGGPVLKGKTTRYWDCCKPSCAWDGKASVNKAVDTCNIDGTSIDTISYGKNGCEDGGVSYMCKAQQPWAVNDNLAYGFAAAKLVGKGENDWCCACYELTFTNGAASGKKMIVQATNTGNDLGENHFDIQMPGGGVGIFNGCQKQYGAPDNGWGERYGGVGSRDQCNALPEAIRGGCHWRFDWFRGADNPTVDFRRVRCPDELVAKTHCRRTDD